MDIHILQINIRVITKADGDIKQNVPYLTPSLSSDESFDNSHWEIV